MTLGTTLILCMLCTIALGVAKPMLDRLKIGKGAAMTLLLGLLLLSLVERMAAVFFLLLPCLCWLVELRWWGGRVLTVLGAACIGAACFGLLTWTAGYANAPLLCACFGAAAGALMPYRRMRLAAGVLSVPIMAGIALFLEGYMGLVLPTTPAAYYGGGVLALLLSSFAAFLREKKTSPRRRLRRT